MCRYISGIVYKTGELMTSQYTDSHESLIKWLNLDDSAPIESRTWIRVEFCPEDLRDYGDIDKYALKVDEESTPIWFGDGIREHIIEEMTAIVKSSIIKSNKKFLLGGKWILTGDCKVDSIENATIVCMLGASKVGTMRGTSEVGTMRETSKVGTMRETSKVGEMRETSEVGEMWGTSKVGEMRGASKVGEMLDTSEVGEMWGTSKVIQDHRLKNAHD